MTTAGHAIEIALLLLVAYLCGCGLGYAAHLIYRAVRVRPRFEAKVPVAVVPVSAASSPARKSAARRLAGMVEREAVDPMPVPAPVTLRRPPYLPAPRGGKADDLRQIKGIGAKTESALHDLGIYHLDQVAAWTSAHIDWLEGRIAVKGRIRREQWVEQAVLLLTATASA